MINAGLETKWLESYDDPKSGLSKEFRVYMKALGDIRNAKIGCPRMVIEASLTSEALQRALYMLCFDAGELKVWVQCNHSYT